MNVRNLDEENGRPRDRQTKLNACAAVELRLFVTLIIMRDGKGVRGGSERLSKFALVLDTPDNSVSQLTVCSRLLLAQACSLGAERSLSVSARPALSVAPSEPPFLSVAARRWLAIPQLSYVL